MNAKKLGFAGAILALALLFGGCGVHAGFHIGKSSDASLARVTQATAGQPQLR